MPKTLADIGLEKWQADFVIQKYSEGMRSFNLGSQPAPWILRGLQTLELGETLTPERIKDFNNAGGTNEPDPYFV
jgi:hypothetical protein